MRSSRRGAHHLDNHDAPVTDRRGVQSIERVHHHIDRRIESEGRRCCLKIVIDCLRTPITIDTASCNCWAVTGTRRRPQ